MDKQRPNKIKHSFEQQHDDAFLEQHLPAGLWDQLSDHLDQAPPIETEGHTVKESFETQYDEAALDEALPNTLWSQIAHELDRPEGHTVKDSFEQQAAPEVPNAVWNAVEEHLEIETVWKKIRTVLDRRTQARYWREKALQISLVCLALLWVRSCEWHWNPVQTPDPARPAATTTTAPLAANSSTTAPLNNASTPKSPAPVIAPNQGTAGQKNLPATAVETVAAQASNPLADANGQAEARPSRTTTSPTQTQGTVVSEPTNPRPAAPTLPSQNSTRPTGNPEAATNNTASAAVPEAISPQIPIVAEAPTTPETNAASKETDAPKQVGAQTTTPVETTQSVAQSATPEMESAPNPAVGPLLVAAALPDQLTTTVEPSLVTSTTTLANKATPKHHWEVGLQAKVSTSLFWGNFTAKALEASSMTTTEIQTTAGLGIVAAWHWSHRDAFLLTAHPSINSRQYFGGYTTEGRYYHQQLTLTHAEGTMSYQRTLWQKHLWRAQSSRLYARAQYNFSHLTRGEERLNDELVETTQQYQRWQHSMGLALGISQQIHHWVIDIGAYGNYGLSTMSPTGTTWEDSRLINWGGYLGLRYRL